MRAVAATKTIQVRAVIPKLWAPNTTTSTMRGTARAKISRRLTQWISGDTTAGRLGKPKKILSQESNLRNNKCKISPSNRKTILPLLLPLKINLSSSIKKKVVRPRKPTKIRSLRLSLSLLMPSLNRHQQLPSNRILPPSPPPTRRSSSSSRSLNSRLNRVEILRVLRCLNKKSKSLLSNLALSNLLQLE